MKCPRCGYHSLPGAATCGQCGAGAAAPAPAVARIEEIYPPRARHRALPQRAFEGTRVRLRLRLRLRPIGEIPTAGRNRNLNPNLNLPRARPWLITSASVFPGLGQWLEGRRREAGRLFGLACLLAIGIITTIRYPVSQALLALALLLAWYSVWDTAQHCFPPSVDDDGARLLRLARLGLLSASVVFSTLAGAYALLAHQYELLDLNTDRYAPLFQRADELMIRRSDHPLARLRRGDVIIGSPNGADPGEWEAIERGEEGEARPTAWVGPVIDRVLGLPGDRIDGAGTRLWVNGALLPPERRPLFDTTAPPFTAVVPRGCVAVWRPPGTLPQPGLPSDPGPLLMLPEADINGRVVVVDQPVERRRWVR